MHVFNNNSTIQILKCILANTFIFCSADSQYNTATINTNVIVSYTGEVGN